MQQEKRMSVSARGKSFKYASNGIRLLFVREPNAQLHALATVVIIVAAFLRHLSPGHWIALVFAIGIVWVAEAFNTCIEKICDYCCDNQVHPAIKVIKDISAAAVLIAAAVSVVVGILVFL